MKWISVKKRLPKKGQAVLVIIKIGGIYYEPFTCDFNGKEFFEPEDYSQKEYWSDSVSHWMELPKPPKDEA